MTRRHGVGRRQRVRADETRKVAFGKCAPSKPNQNSAQDRVLAGYAKQIHARAKRTVKDIIKIGELLTKAKERAGHGNWLPWLDREFGWSHDTASRFMRLFKFSRTPNFARVRNLPCKVLLRLAKAPAETIDAVAERAESVTDESSSAVEWDEHWRNRQKREDAIRTAAAEAHKRRGDKAEPVWIESIPVEAPPTELVWIRPVEQSSETDSAESSFTDAIAYALGWLEKAAEMDVPPHDDKWRREMLKQLKQIWAAASELRERIGVRAERSA